MTEKVKHGKLTSTEDYVDFWFNEIGVNVIPFNTKDRKPILAKEEHARYFEELMTAQEFESFKENGYYHNGFMITLGEIKRGKYKGKYLNGLDLDNKKAIQEFCAGRSLSELSKEFIVEQKAYDDSKCHILWFSDYPIKALAQTSDKDGGPEFSIKTKGPFFVSNSPNKDGGNYEFIENCTLDPSVYPDVEKHIDDICEKYGISYLSKGRSETTLAEIPEKIQKGERDNRLFEFATEILKTSFGETMDEHQLYLLVMYENNKRCDEPLGEPQIRKICKSAYNFKKGIKEEDDKTLQKYLKYKENKEKEKNKDDIDRIIEGLHLKMLGGEMYYYNSETGNYVPGGQDLIENIFTCNLRKSRKKSIVKEVNEKVKIVSYIIEHIRAENFNPNLEWLGTKNCMLNVKTGETKAFSPDFMNTTSLPVVYNPTQKFKGSEIQKFLNRVMSPKDVELMLDYIAYCLWREYKFAHFLLLNGLGNNGKGTLIRLIQQFLGRQNYSAQSLHRLLDNNFATSSLFGKLANFDADLKKSAFLKNGTDIIKVLTGNDESTAEEKFMKDFKFTNYAKLIMACNEIPTTPDRTPAFAKRLIQINFINIFYGEDDDVNLIDKLTTEQELSGLLNECLRRLPNVLENGIRKFTKEIEKEVWDKYDASINPFGYFERKVLLRTNNEDDKISVREMYEYFNEFKQREGLTYVSEETLNSRLHDLKYETRRVLVNGERRFFWVGVQKNEQTPK